MRLVWRAVVWCTLAAGLCACSSTDEIPGRMNTESARQIERTLTEMAAEDTAAPESRLPPEVSDALLPDMIESAPQAPEERFDIAVSNVNAPDFFLGLVQGTPYNLVVHPDLSGSITLDLKNVTLQQVLNVTRELYGYDYQYQQGIYRILPSGMRTEVFQINYLDITRTGSSDILVSSGQLSNSVSGSGDNSGNGGISSGTESAVLSRISTLTASDFWATLQESLESIVGEGEGRRVIANRSSGIVLVKAMPEEISSVRDYLRKSQLIMQRQVVLEAKILEVSLNEGHQQGINWTYFNDISNDRDAAGNPLDFVRLGLSSAPLTNITEGIFGATVQTNNFSAFIELLSTQGSVQVLSSPRIATINNQKAVIKVGSDEFFVTGVETSDGGDNDADTTDVEITPFFSGIALDVTPQIGGDDSITLHVHPTISMVEDQTKTIVLGNRQIVLPLALSTVRETDSIIKARNGQVVVIGGLIRNVAQDDGAEVPWFGNIPLLGEAFKQKRRSGEKSELVILIRPTLVEDASFTQDIESSRNRFQQLRTQIENDYQAP